MPNVTPVVIAVLLAELVPAAAFGFASERAARAIARWPLAVRVALPALLVAPYVVIAATQHMFRWQWFALYAALPVVIAWLLSRAAVGDPEQRGNWRDALILIALGLAVDLRWFDVAWPSGLRGLNNLLLVDAGLYGFLAIRRLDGTGFDFHPHWSDWKTGLRELVYFAPAVLALGLALGFLHPHANVPALGKAALTWAGIFVFVAGAGRTLLSRLGAKSAGAASRPPRGAADRLCPVWLVAFQQKIPDLQLALRAAGHDRGNLLWPGLA